MTSGPPIYSEPIESQGVGRRISPETTKERQENRAQATGPTPGGIVETKGSRKTRRVTKKRKWTKELKDLQETGIHCLLDQRLQSIGSWAQRRYRLGVISSLKASTRELEIEEQLSSHQGDNAECNSFCSAQLHPARPSLLHVVEAFLEPQEVKNCFAKWKSPRSCQGYLWSCIPHRAQKYLCKLEGIRRYGESEPWL